MHIHCCSNRKKEEAFLTILKKGMTSLACNAKLGSWLNSLPSDGRRRVYCSPCSLSNDVYSVVALYDDKPARWFELSCASALYTNGTDVDVQKSVKDFKKGFDRLYSEEFNALNVLTLPKVLSFTASIGDNVTAVTSIVYLLPDGTVLCFESKDIVPAPDLMVLQRTCYSSAKTFDALLMPKSHNQQQVLELRLVEKRHRCDVEKWALSNEVVSMCSPGEPIPARLLLQLYKEGCNAEAIVDVFLNPSDDDDMSDRSEDEEWCADEEEDDEGSSEDDDSDFEVADAEEELANLR